MPRIYLDFASVLKDHLFLHLSPPPPPLKTEYPPPISENAISKFLISFAKWSEYFMNIVIFRSEFMQENFDRIMQPIQEIEN